jgi:hypothetical protein
MGRDSQRLLLLAAGVIGLAGANTFPSCWVCENIFVKQGCTDEETGQLHYHSRRGQPSVL